MERGQVLIVAAASAIPYEALILGDLERSGLEPSVVRTVDECLVAMPKLRYGSVIVADYLLVAGQGNDGGEQYLRFLHPYMEGRGALGLKLVMVCPPVDRVECFRSYDGAVTCYVQNTLEPEAIARYILETWKRG